jgi:coatomer subunit beta'
MDGLSLLYLFQKAPANASRRVYICDKDLSVMSYALSLAVVEFQTLVLRGELEEAMGMLPDIPEDQKTKIARFLEGQELKEEALEVSTDSEHRFDLALSLNKLDIALELAREKNEEHKWRLVGDAALQAWDIKLSEECFWKANDMGSLLLFYSASGDSEGLRKLADRAKEAKKFNVQFECLWLLGDVNGCVELLKETDRNAEAVLFAQTYKPSIAPGAVAAWKSALEKEGKGRVARVIAAPPGTEGFEADEDLFPEWEEWLKIEEEGGVKLVDVEEDEDDEAEAELDAEEAEVEVEAEDEDEDAAEEEAA